MTNDELIRRSDVMDSLTREYNRRHYDHGESGLRLAWIEKAVNEVPTAAPKWIPFAERIPKPGQMILLSAGDAVITVRYHSFDDFAGCAWMKLPEPYQEGKQ